jgi:hypothetical protein
MSQQGLNRIQELIAERHQVAMMQIQEQAYRAQEASYQASLSHQRRHQHEAHIAHIIARHATRFLRDKRNRELVAVLAKEGWEEGRRQLRRIREL